MRKKLLLSLLGLLYGLAVAWAQEQTVTGKVTDATGTGIPGVSIYVKGTTIGTVTGADGAYRLNASSGSTLVFQSVGLKTQEVLLGSQSALDISMTEDTTQLNEVVVQAYGTIEKDKVIGSVSTVKAAAFEQVPLTSFDQMLQGRTPGLLSTTTSGQPGSTTQVRIRGVGSITAASSPLYVIDGIPVAAGDFTQNTETSNIFANLNPNDIESTTILKDAAAASLYGARAANGVVLITTKKGKSGRTNFNLRMQQGFNTKSTGAYEVMNSTELLGFERDALFNLGLPANVVNAIRPLGIDATNTDWVNEAYRTGKTRSYDLSASGGSEKTTFFISGSYFDQEGTLIESRMKRYSTRFGITHTASDKLNIGMSLNLSRTDQDNADAGNNFLSPILGAFLLLPYDPIIDPETGELANFDLDPKFYNNGFIANNFVKTVRLNERKNNNSVVVGNVNASYKIIPNLTFSTKLGLNYIDINEDSFDHPDTPDGRNAYNNGQKAKVRTYDITLTTSNTLNYQKTFLEKHSIDFLVGYEAQDNDNNTVQSASENFAVPELQNISSGATPTIAAETGAEYSFVSYFSRVNYDYKNKYFFTASFRRDGSSRFGKANRFANFFSVGGSWRIIEEGFVKGLSFLTDLKLRASYGTSGNAEIGNYAHLGTFAFNGSYNNNLASIPNTVENPNLTWEKNKTYNIGLDFGVFKNRLTGSVEFYNRKTTDLLQNVPISSTSGYQTALRNIGAMQNQGWEISLTSTNLDVGGFRWITDFNIAFNKNKVTKLNSPDPIIGRIQSTIIGEPINVFNMPAWAGVDPDNGDPLWYDEAGNLTNDYSSANQRLMGSPNPKFFGGFTNTFSYKGIELSAFFYFVSGNKIYNDAAYIFESDGAFFGVNQTRAALNYWKNPGDIAKNPKPVAGGNLNSNSDSSRYLEDGSFLRLRNISLAYNLPANLLTKTRVFTGVRVYVQGQNLITFTKYKGFDPEMGVNGVEFFRYPNSRSLTFGLDLSF